MILGPTLMHSYNLVNIFISTSTLGSSQPRNGRPMSFSDDRAGPLENQTTAHVPPSRTASRVHSQKPFSARGPPHTHRPTRAKRIGRPPPIAPCCVLMPSLLSFASASTLFESVLSSTERSLYFVAGLNGLRSLKGPLRHGRQ